MRNKTLNGLVIFFAVVLGSVLFLSDRSISHFMEYCGALISQAFGL